MRKIVHIYYMLLLLFPFSVFTMKKQENNTLKKITFSKPLTKIQKLKNDGSVWLVSDAKNQKYITKKHTDEQSTLMEVLSAEIANKCNIPAHQATILSKKQTVHTYITGQHPTTLNIDLPCLLAIKALDIFIDNLDRHELNIIFNRLKAKMYAIDMASATLENHQLQSFIINIQNKKNYSFADRQIAQTLLTINTIFTPQKILTTYKRLAKQTCFSNFKEESLLKILQQKSTLIKKLENIFSKK